MGTTLLGDVLSDWCKYELDDSIYLPADMEASLDLEFSVTQNEGVSIVVRGGL
jgi:hypothetical protein